MRIIAGEFKGRRLNSLKGDNTRPTSDKIKGSIFNMIGPYFDGGNCLDLYSGSGNLAIESISRGMAHAYCFDCHYPAIKIIEENVKMIQASERFTIKKMNDKKALAHLSQQKITFDVVFLDPPYAKEQLQNIIESILELGLLNPYGVIVCEMDKSVQLPDQMSPLSLKKEQTYGITKIAIYEWECNESE